MQQNAAEEPGNEVCCILFCS